MVSGDGAWHVAVGLGRRCVVPSVRRPRRAKRRKVRAAPRSVRARERREAALATLAHEIRTPLNGILALSELIAAADLAEREREWAAQVKSAAEHLARSRRWWSTACAPRARARAARGAVSAARARRGGSARRSRRAPKRRGSPPMSSIADDLPELRDRRSRAAARRAGESDRQCGEIHRARACRLVGRRGARRRAGAHRLSFAVTDSGIGLTQAEIARLFRPFAQANADIARRFGGAGLGLCFRAAAREGDGRRSDGREPRRAGQHVPSHASRSPRRRQARRAPARALTASALRAREACACSARRTIPMRASCSTRS